MTVDNQILVSVILPTYNRASFLSRAIQSVLDQTYPQWELIIVDDASTDNTRAVVLAFEDPRIHYLHHEMNLGQCSARNAGINASRGGYYAFLDSDDEWLPNKLERQLYHFSKCAEDVGAVYCSHYESDELTANIQKPPLLRGNVYKHLLSGWCPAGTSLFMLRASVLKKSGMFDENLPSYTDYDLWIRIARHYDFEYVDEPLVIIYKHYGSHTSKDLKPRTEGLSFFVQKWGEVITKEAGADSLNSLLRKQLYLTYHSAAVDSLLHSKRKEGLAYLRKASRLRPISFTFLFKVLILLIGGRNLLLFSVKLFRIFRPSQKGLVEILSASSPVGRISSPPTVS